MASVPSLTDQPAPAVTGGHHRVPFVDLRSQTQQLDAPLKAAIARVLARGDFVLGEDVEHFEEEFASYCGVRHAVGVDSGFSALELGLRAAHIGPGDEVITQANTFIATASAIQAVGARPVLTDCDPHGGMDPSAVVAAISPRTRAIMAVHLFGRIGEIDAIAGLAAEKGLALIEDACQAHGAQWNGRRAGSFGMAAAFSFYPAKNLGAFGDAGILVTDQDQISDEVRLLRHYGQRVKYWHLTTPLNRRLDTIQAAILRIKLRHLDEWNARRQELAAAYRELLAGLPIGLPPQDEPGRHVYHLFVIEVEDRDGLRNALAAEDIETGIHYPIPLHQQPALKALGYPFGAFAHTEWLASHSLSLPMYPELPLGDVHRVSSTIRRFLER